MLVTIRTYGVKGARNSSKFKQRELPPNSVKHHSFKGDTVEPLLRGHPRDQGNSSLNGG